jgi:hypothetical protein
VRFEKSVNSVNRLLPGMAPGSCGLCGKDALAGLEIGGCTILGRRERLYS